MNNQYYLIDGKVMAEQCHSHPSEGATPNVDTRLRTLHRNSLYETDIRENAASLIRLASLSHEITIIEANLPEYRFTYEGTAEREYKVIFNAHVDTFIRIPIGTISSSGLNISELRCNRNQTLILNFTITRKNNKTIAVLEADLELINVFPKIGQTETRLGDLELNTELLNKNINLVKENQNDLGLRLESVKEIASNTSENLKLTVERAAEKVENIFEKYNNDKNTTLNKIEEIDLKLVRAVTRLSQKSDEIEANCQQDKDALLKLISEIESNKLEMKKELTEIDRNLIRQLSRVEGRVTDFEIKGQKLFEEYRKDVETGLEKVDNINNRINGIENKGYELFQSYRKDVDVGLEKISKVNSRIDYIEEKAKELFSAYDKDRTFALNEVNAIKNELKNNSDDILNNTNKIKDILLRLDAIDRKIKEICCHDFNDWVILKEATCYEMGKKERVCNKCNKKEKDIISAFNHDWIWSITRASTCVREGIETKTCTICNKTDETRNTSALGHHISEWTITEKPTCENIGKKIGSCERENCNYQLIFDVPALGHNFQLKEKVGATCQEYGYSIYKCTRCDESYKDDIVNAVECTFESKVIAPTCTSQGYTEHICKKCGNTFIDSLTPMLTTHDFRIEKVIEPTCNSLGYTIFICNTCGLEFVDAKIMVPPLTHDFERTNILPTCEKPGGFKDKCKRCGYEQTEIIEFMILHPHFMDDGTGRIVCFNKLHKMCADYNTCTRTS